MGEPIPLRCAIYCRISQDRESEERGITRQEEDCRALADRNGWEVVKVYVDNDLSASTRSRKRRPDFEAMMTHAEGGHLDVLVSYSNSRLTRRPLELERLIGLHQQTGVFLSTVVSGDDNLSTAEGRMTARIKASIDAAEAERTGERVERAARQRREEGRLHGGARTFGYVHGSPEGYCQEIDPVAAAAIRQAVDILLSGGKVAQVRKAWQDAGVLTPLGKEWRNDGNIARTLRNPRIAGLVAHDGEIVGEGKWPAIIDRATHEALLGALGTRGAKGNGGPPKVRKYLLPGFAYCLCGTPMSAQVWHPGEDSKGTWGRTGVDRYICASQRGGCGKVTRSRPWLEDAVREWVAGAIEGKIAGTAGPVDDPNAEIEREIRELEARIKRLQVGYDGGVYTIEEASGQIIPLREQVQALRAKQGDLAKEAVAAYVDKDEELDDWWSEDPDRLHVRREILARYVSRIIVKPVGKGANSQWGGTPLDSVVIIPR